MSPRRSTPRGPVTQEAEAPAQPLELAPLRFSEAPLSVRVIPDPPKPAARPWLRPLLWVILFFVAAAIFIFWAAYVLPPANLPTGPLPTGNLTGTAIGYTAPKYIFLAAENTVAVTVLNTSTAPFTGTVTLAFSPEVSLSILPDPDGNTSFKVENLPPAARYSQRIRFMLNESPAAGKFEFQLKAETPDGHSGVTDWQPMELAPFSFLHRILKLLAGSSLLAALIGLFWERGKRLLFPD
jgi:hypothetical protein